MNSNVSSGKDTQSILNEENENNETESGNQRRHHRHTPYQIQRMEEYFWDNPHLDKTQREELSEELGMEPLQVKFWFQNKRTQMKAKNEHKEGTFLRARNKKLREENLRLRQSFHNACCLICGRMVAVGDLCYGERHFRMENARLREEINLISTMAVNYIGKPLKNYDDAPSTSSSSSVLCSTDSRELLRFLARTRARANK